MENNTLYIEPLLERAEQYGKTSYELIKLKAVYKTTLVASKIVSRFAFFMAVSMAIAILTVGVALWLGDVLGKSYYGFFCVAAFYTIVGGVLHFFLRAKIRSCVSNSIISQMLN